jgi:hypothetical protein
LAFWKRETWRSWIPITSKKRHLNKLVMKFSLITFVRFFQSFGVKTRLGVMQFVKQDETSNQKQHSHNWEHWTLFLLLQKYWSFIEAVSKYFALTSVCQKFDTGVEFVALIFFNVLISNSKKKNSFTKHESKNRQQEVPISHEKMKENRRTKKQVTLQKSPQFQQRGFLWVPFIKF